MASPLLALIGEITLFIVGAAAIIICVVLVTQGFLALFRALGILK